jgi:hypothetical protein
VQSGSIPHLQLVLSAFSFSQLQDSVHPAIDVQSPSPPLQPRTHSQSLLQTLTVVVATVVVVTGGVVVGLGVVVGAGVVVVSVVDVGGIVVPGEVSVMPGVVLVTGNVVVTEGIQAWTLALTEKSVLSSVVSSSEMRTWLALTCGIKSIGMVAITSSLPGRTTKSSLVGTSPNGTEAVSIFTVLTLPINSNLSSADGWPVSSGGNTSVNEGSSSIATVHGSSLSGLRFSTVAVSGLNITRSLVITVGFFMFSGQISLGGLVVTLGASVVVLTSPGVVAVIVVVSSGVVTSVTVVSSGVVASAVVVSSGVVWPSVVVSSGVV